MVILVERDQGRTVKATEALVSGLFVVISDHPDGEPRGAKLAALTGTRFGMAYLDQMEAENRRNMHLDNASLTSLEGQDIASGTRFTVLYGRGRVMTNQLTNGLYQPGDQLTINTTTAKLEKAGAAAAYYAQVAETHKGGPFVGNGKAMISVFFSTAAPLGTTPA